MNVKSVQIKPGQAVNRGPLRRILAALAPGDGEEGSSLYLPPETVAGWTGGRGSMAGGWSRVLAQLDRSVAASDTGLVGLRVGTQGVVVLPPFPVGDEKFVDRWDTGPLLANVDADHVVGVVLLRLGRSSVGVFKGDELLVAKTDARYVKGRHHAGGTSQRRFERIREGQARKMYDKTCEAVRAQLAPHARELEYVFLGGDRITLNEFRKVCPHLEQFSGITLDRRLNIRDPKRDTLEQVPEMIRECRLYPVQFGDQ